MRADRAARAYDSRIVQVRAGYNDELRHILIAASDGTFASDTQPLARFNCYVIARDGSKNSRGGSGGGGRVELSFFEGESLPSTLPAKRPDRPSCNSMPLPLRQATWKWFWARLARRSLA